MRKKVNEDFDSEGKRTPKKIEEIEWIDEKPRRRRKKKPQKTPGKSEYLWAVFSNIILLYFFNHLSDWRVDFLTDRFSLCLPAINLSIGVAVLGNLLLLIYDERKFHSIVRTLMNFFLATSFFVVYQIFPFSFSSFSPFNGSLFVRIILLLATVGMGVATILELLDWLLVPEGKKQA